MKTINDDNTEITSIGIRIKANLSYPALRTHGL